MAAILETLVRRIGKLDDSKIRLIATPSLPVDVLIAHIDAHHNNYLELQTIRVCTTYYVDCPIKLFLTFLINFFLFPIVFSTGET